MTPTPSRPRRPTPTTFLCTNDLFIFLSLNLRYSQDKAAYERRVRIEAQKYIPR